MKYPRKRRPQRAWHWHGYVEDVDATTLWIVLARANRPAGDPGIEVQAEFPRRLLPDAEPGIYVTLYVHRRGRKHRTILRPVEMPPLTQEQRDDIRRYAHERLAWINAVLGDDQRGNEQPQDVVGLVEGVGAGAGAGVVVRAGPGSAEGVEHAAASPGGQTL